MANGAPAACPLVAPEFPIMISRIAPVPVDEDIVAEAVAWV
jgi:hypothetical protein